jgi:pimeloyl-ACP methyl ester carboxylesterase
MNDPRPHLAVDGPADAEAVVLVLHGGRSQSRTPVPASALAVLRMRPFAHRIGRVGRGRIAVASLRFAVRGWNGADASPVIDARWALDQLAERFGDVPLGLVGHSMGGRAALRAAGHRGVESVVGLAPWLGSGEPIAQLRGRRVLLVHGSRDRTTSAEATAAYADGLRRAGIAASFVEVPGDGHGMLRRARLWHDLAAGFMAATLLDPDPSARLPVADVLQPILAGASRVTA